MKSKTRIPPATVLPIPQAKPMIHGESRSISYGWGIYKSTDGGVTWNAANSGLKSSFVLTLAIDSVHATTIYAGTWDGRIFKSADGGANWSVVFVAPANSTRPG